MTACENTSIGTIPSPAALFARARAMIPALAARAAGAQRARHQPAETIAEMQAAGFFRVLQPKRWGGYEMNLGTFFDIQIARAEGDMSPAWIYGVVGLHPWLLALRLQYKYQSAAAMERCSALAVRLFKLTGGSGLYDEHPFGRMLADINAGRQHNANQYETVARNWGAALLGLEPRQDLAI